MATIESEPILKMWIKTLQVSIKNKNKKAILNCYEVFEEKDFDWDKYPKYFKQYDKLVDAGNNILYS